MNSDFSENELDETLKVQFSAAVDGQPVQPILADAVKVSQRKSSRQKWVIGGATVLVAGIVTTLLTMTLVPSSAPQPMAPAPSASGDEGQTETETVFVGSLGHCAEPNSGEYYTDPETGAHYFCVMDPATGETTIFIVPDHDSSQVARFDYETGQFILLPVAPGSNLPAPPEDAPKIGATTPDSSWKTYDLLPFGISVQLPKNMKAFKDTDFYRLDTKAIRSDEDMRGIMVLSEFLAVENGPVPPYDLGSVPGLKDAKGRQVHIGYFDNSDSTEDWAEFMLIVPDESQPGGYDAVLSFGKSYVYFGGNDLWAPLTKDGKKDRALIVAILASVQVSTTK
ncbi:MAG: hypothetical protein LBK28_02275 [Propionibacteriaceae bacterium]|jgi:hypothetical protein|nr:hypothetical protein [Propionibacteriaceae bacterium]